MCRPTPTRKAVRVPVCAACRPLPTRPHTHRRLERSAEGGIDFHYYDNKEQAGGIIKAAQVREKGGCSVFQGHVGSIFWLGAGGSSEAAGGGHHQGGAGGPQGQQLA